MKLHPHLIRAVILAAALLTSACLAACQAQAPAAQPTPWRESEPTAAKTAPPPIAKPGAAATPTAAPALTPAVENEMARAARADLAARLGIDAAQIVLIEARAVTWGDGSLGCPKPGMMYTQSLEPGWLARLRAGGRIYEYHSAGSLKPFYCENPSKPAPGVE